jgi:uncharacterized protein (TIGR03083 family)
MQGTSADALKIASSFFVQVVALVSDGEWNSPGLGRWSLLELVGHTNRAHTTLEDYLLRPQPPVPRDSHYFSEDSIAQRGRESVAALGDNPPRTIRETSRRICALVDDASPEATIGSPARTMTLTEYLPSRTAELTIHGIDIVRALGSELAAPSEALAESLAFITGWCVTKGMGEIVLRALSGRQPLPSGFSVY